MELKYLFEAIFDDGTVIAQTAEDQSQIDPQKSAFYDVLQKKAESPMTHFGIYGENNTFAVDLLDGHFEVNGIPIWLQPVSQDIIPPGGRYDLIYFRDHRHQFVMCSELIDQTNHEVGYRIGWDYTSPDGQTYTQCMVVR